MLSRIELSHFRNFSQYEIDAAPSFNLFVGKNGSGKTSLLEAIYFFSMGRSFRNPSYLACIQHQQSFFRLIGNLTNASAEPCLIGIEKNTNNTLSQTKINGVAPSNNAELARLLPMQLVHHETFHLLDAGPQYRREFIDWGVFYTEPQFFQLWQHFQRALKQRNALLKNPDAAQYDFWEKELANYALQIDQLRRLYLTLLLPVLEELIAPLGFVDTISIHYHSGWDQQREYLQVLQKARQRDEILGSTQSGPHRADLKIKAGSFDVDHILSRGQQKMLSFAMRIAQALLLQRLHQQNCVFLVDDLASELDAEHLAFAFAMLAKLKAQTFITAIHTHLFDVSLSNVEHKMFHVEH